MTIKVEKRDKEIEQFDREKIKLAVMKAMKDMETVDEESAEKVAKKAENKVKQYLKEWRGNTTDTIAVDIVHKMVENSIMDVKLYDVAREYIGYRKEHKPDIFRERSNVRPYEYPDLLEYMYAIYDSFWTHREFSYGADIQDMRVNMEPKERTAIARTMLAISTVEVKAVKDYWAKVGDRMPKAEIGMVGAAFSNNEVIHLLAYANLLELMGLNKDFENVDKIPALRRRLDYLKASMRGREGSNKEFVRTLILFALFTENVSLFSQFLIMLTINKERNLLKGISNAVQSTQKEEAVHASFGIRLVNIVREENPEWFDEEMEQYVNEMLMESYEAESAIIDWIFEEGEWDYLPVKDIDMFLKDRYNQSMVACGFPAPFEVDGDYLAEKFEWFDVECRTTNRIDFFNKKSTNYQRKNVAIDIDDLI